MAGARKSASTALIAQRSASRSDRAKQFTAELAFGQTVTVVPMGRDRYGRTVADVFLSDNRLLSHELVKAGFAWWYRRYALENIILEQL
jgi:micrococcal nuclease